MASKRKSMQTHEQYDDEVYYMAVALMFSKKSPDPNTKVGACIVNEEKKIVGVGFNKMPDGCEDEFPWEREAKDKPETDNPFVCHAAWNAIMNKTSVDVKGCTMYVTLFPCNECTKVIIQSGNTRARTHTHTHTHTHSSHVYHTVIRRLS
ncbi:deoxycytidylate deaminase-like [Tachysurus fulvidraco]|uniref:deoxycytidylate deaminase-like n=1 Tax=Tachysurus fulvidraco TaxID=1234273 RepID=UPI001FEF908D|nr:deoxycytidylate deaminase-like [Tachysurus fulvidraco]